MSDAAQLQFKIQSLRARADQRVASIRPDADDEGMAATSLLAQAALMRARADEFEARLRGVVTD